MVINQTLFRFSVPSSPELIPSPVLLLLWLLPSCLPLLLPLSARDHSPNSISLSPSFSSPKPAYANHHLQKTGVIIHWLLFEITTVCLSVLSPLFCHVPWNCDVFNCLERDWISLTCSRCYVGLLMSVCDVEVPQQNMWRHTTPLRVLFNDVIRRHRETMVRTNHNTPQETTTGTVSGMCFGVLVIPFIYFKSKS